MRAALLDNSTQRRAANALTASIPAPVGGWNTRDSVAAMSPTDALILDNWFPRQGYCQLRGGNTSFATSMTGAVKTLTQYVPPASAAKLYAVTDSGIYTITAGGGIGGVAQALTNGYWNSINFANSAGTAYLWGCNGTDTPKMFDGTTWSTPSITAGTTGTVTSQNLIFPLAFKHRIFAIEKNTMNLWYLAIDSIQGAMEKLPYGNIFKRGGFLQSATAWTLDSGEGSDDLLVVVSSQGELAIYKGIDPSSASSWSLVGVWQVGKPCGYRCFQQLGGDCVVITENGVWPLSKLLQSGTVNFQKALTNKIQPSFTALAAAAGVTTEGWEACVYPQFDALVVNVPATASSPASQAVMNTATGAWCSFSNWAASSFIVFNGSLYYGTTGGVVKRAWGTLVSDSGADIVGTAYQAYNYFGRKNLLKQVKLFRLLASYSAAVEFRWAISQDFTDVSITSIARRENLSGGTPWDTGKWDVSPWLPPSLVRKLWRAAAHIPGFALSLRLQMATNSSMINWAGTDYILQEGGAL